MIKEIKMRTIKNKNNYISECEVLDTETNEKFYVVTQLGDLMYSTFKSSYIDYVIGKTKESPIKVEGGDQMWLDYEEAANDTRFLSQYEATFDEALTLKNKYYIKHKYSHLKKPLGNIPYKIINKKSELVHSCGPLGDNYEIEFLILSDNSHLFVYSDNVFDEFVITDYSVMEAMEKDNSGELEGCYKDPIEHISSFGKAKKSKYYDLYLEMEKYKDNYQQN